MSGSFANDVKRGIVSSANYTTTTALKNAILRYLREEKKMPESKLAKIATYIDSTVGRAVLRTLIYVSVSSASRVLLNKFSK